MMRTKSIMNLRQQDVQEFSEQMQHVILHCTLK